MLIDSGRTRPQQTRTQRNTTHLRRCGREGQVRRRVAAASFVVLHQLKVQLCHRFWDELGETLQCPLKKKPRRSNNRRQAQQPTNQQQQGWHVFRIYFYISNRQGSSCSSKGRTQVVGSSTHYPKHAGRRPKVHAKTRTRTHAQIHNANARAHTYSRTHLHPQKLQLNAEDLEELGGNHSRTMLAAA